MRLNVTRSNTLMILVVGGLILAGVVFVLNDAPTLSQDNWSCDNPFDGVDIRFNPNSWDTDFCQTNIDMGEILWGGVPRDGIPPIDNPEFDDIETASEWLQPQSPVVIVTVDDITRAYPLAIMTRHEIVNDVFGDVPVAVTYCPLCNSALAFVRQVDDVTLRMGVSGNLRNSDLVMWDDVTESWWQQFTGEGIVGEYTGTQLEILPTQLFGFGAFVEQFPDGTVLSPGSRSYGRNGYFGYDTDAQPFLYDGDFDTRLFPVARVLAGVIDELPMAYSLETLADEIVVNDVIGETNVVALWQPGATSALDGPEIDSSRDVGMAALYDRDLDGQTLTFIVDADGAIRDEQTDTVWNVFGTAIEGELAGSQLRQLLAAPHFWFAWAAFHPATPVYIDGEIVPVD